MEITNVGIIGLGALGVMFSSQIMKNAPGTLKVIADKQRIERYRKNGIFLNDKKCAFDYLAPEEPLAELDLLLVSVKYGALQDAIKLARSFVSDNTIILSMLNGISSEADLAEAFGEEKILYCVAQGMDATNTGHGITFSQMGYLCFGEKDNAKSERLLAVSRYFDRAGIPYEIPTDMMYALWNKFMLNVGVNQASTVFDAPYSKLLAPGKAHDAMIGAMREVKNIAAKESVNLTEKDIDRWIEMLKTLHPNGVPSMKQDANAKRKSEVELFSGAVIKLGIKHGIQTPVNNYFYKIITDMELHYE